MPFLLLLRCCLVFLSYSLYSNFHCRKKSTGKVPKEFLYLNLTNTDVFMLPNTSYILNGSSSGTCASFLLKQQKLLSAKWALQHEVIKLNVEF